MEDNDLKRDEPKYPKQCVSFSIGIAPSINHMYIGKTKRLTKVAEKYVKETQDICSKALRAAHWKVDNPHVWYYLDLYFFMPDKRIRDSHNCLKLLMDSLQGVLFSNDYFVLPRIQLVELDKDNPRIDVMFFSQEVM